jgi:hypothetical protein
MDTKQISDILSEMIQIIENDNQIMNTFSVVADSEEFKHIIEFVKENEADFISLDVFWNLENFHLKVAENYDLLHAQILESQIPDAHKIVVALKSFKTLTYDPILETIDESLKEAVIVLAN